MFATCLEITIVLYGVVPCTFNLYFYVSMYDIAPHPS